jgi:hypothetical protein
MHRQHHDGTKQDEQRIARVFVDFHSASPENFLRDTSNIQTKLLVHRFDIIRTIVNSNKCACSVQCTMTLSMMVQTFWIKASDSLYMQQKFMHH